MKESFGSPTTTISPLLLRNLLISLFIYADTSLRTLAQKYKLLQLLRYLLISAFLRLLPSLDPSSETNYGYRLKSPNTDNFVSTNTGGGGNGGGGGGGESGIGRALSQLLLIVNDIPVSSRKYEVVRSLAEKLIDENLQEGSAALREVNYKILSAAFSRTLSQLEAAVMDRKRNHDCPSGAVAASEDFGNVNRVCRAVRYYGDVVLARLGKRVEPRWSGSSAEKLAAEVLWLAQKMVACGCAEEAVCKWASATHLAWLSLSAEPRIQGSVVKVSAFLFKQARDLGVEEFGEESKKEQQRQTQMKMLMSWLPLLCRASNGTDVPVLSTRERAELERVMEDTIEMLEQEEEQEKVLSLWLHHFTLYPASDWPNLHACYTRWCNVSRKRLLLQ
ncbi:hypothetical protein ACSBR2_022008 [Camellia fascicularis]